MVALCGCVVVCLTHKPTVLSWPVVFARADARASIPLSAFLSCRRRPPRARIDDFTESVGSRRAVIPAWRNSLCCTAGTSSSLYVRRQSAVHGLAATALCVFVVVVRWWVVVGAVLCVWLLCLFFFPFFFLHGLFVGWLVLYCQSLFFTRCVAAPLSCPLCATRLASLVAGHCLDCVVLGRRRACLGLWRLLVMNLDELDGFWRDRREAAGGGGAAAADAVATVLALGRQNLTAVPDAVFEDHLAAAAWVDIELHSNRLTELPDQLCVLCTSLQRLEAQYNAIVTLTPAIGQLQTLTHLELHNNALTSIPSEIGQLTQLHTLLIDSNTISSLPDAIEHLSSLVMLDAGSNQLTALPSAIGALTSLEYLCVANNPLSEVPNGFDPSRSTDPKPWQQFFVLPPKVRPS
eukprot:m.261596 g.261596  ORF g.261596 m.261596 type:complete len:406 (-) comp19225_c1_seq16:213-1430(-)